MTRNTPAAIACIAVVACGGSSVSTGATCGAGTMLVDGQCVATTSGSGGSGGSGGADVVGGASGTAGMVNALDAGGDSTAVDGGAIPKTCPNPTPPPSSLLDDFEDGSLRGWFFYADTTGTLNKATPIDVVGGAPGSTKGMQLTGTGFKPGVGNFGAGAGKSDTCTDVSGYAGFTFWAKGNTPVSAQVGTPRVKPASQGGECPDTQLCSDRPSRVVTIGDTWKQYTVTWSELTQSGWGYRDDFSTRKVINAVQFSAVDAKDAPNGMFEVDIDDVAFVKAGDGGL